jgi:hypothetical protein
LVAKVWWIYPTTGSGRSVHTASCAHRQTHQFEALMQRKLTPLQRLRREFPLAQDSELQNALNHANGDVWVAIDRLSPPNSDLRDRNPPRRNTMPLETFVKMVDKPMLPPQIMAEATPFSPADLPSNNPFKKLLMRHHEWQVNAY